MTSRFVAAPATAEAYVLGEGPVWDPARQRLLWVDILGHRVLAGRLAPGSGQITVTASWSFPDEVGAVAVAADGRLLVARRETVTTFHPDAADSSHASAASHDLDASHGSNGPNGPNGPSGSDVSGGSDASDSPDGGRELARVLPAGGPQRLNDGAVDPAGRFLVGSLTQYGESDGREVLVRLDGDGLTTLDDDLTLSNGLAWDPSGSRLYSIDSVPGVVHGRDYPDGPRTDLFSIDDGLPDGLCTDKSGNLWIAIWGGGRVEHRTPDGKLLGTVQVDAPHTTSVAFAGPDLDTLVITTATDGLSPDDLTKHPHSGRLFTARVEATGFPTPYWRERP